MAEEMVPILFVQSSTPYTSGEIAGFTPGEAAAYVEAGVAIYRNAAKPEVVVADDPKPIPKRRGRKPAANKQSKEG